MISGAHGWLAAVEPDFHPGGVDHIAALLVTVAVAGGMVLWARRNSASRRLRLVEVGLGITLIASWPSMILVAWWQDWLSWEVALPLHWCNVATGIAALALLLRHQRLAELTWFWGLAGTTHGLLTPVMLGQGFPSFWFFVYFIGHSGVIIAALHLVLGRGLIPTRGAVWRVFGWAQVYLLVAWVANLIIGSNFAFLSGKPAEGSLLDYLGPWPYYILVFQILGLTMFWLLDLPFQIARRSRHRTAGAGETGL